LGILPRQNTERKNKEVIIKSRTKSQTKKETQPTNEMI